MKKYFPTLFFASALLMLLVGVIAGVLISINYISPDFFKDYIPFNRLRPVHTTAVISWIVLAAIGGVYEYLRHETRSVFSVNLAITHYGVFFLTALVLFPSLILGKMEGREYLVFPQFLMVPILAGWFLLGWNYFNTLKDKMKEWPVYYWMWGTGIVFMIFHLTESNLWFFDFFRKDFIRDMSIQWKSYGSFVGSWNMLVYGTAIYLTTKIKGDIQSAKGKLPFFFYFLGLTNLMFGWAHHTYFLPTQPWIRYVAYAISMTEWIIFIRIIYLWAKSLPKEKKKIYSLAYKFIMASDLWVFLNLFLALLMSIPAFNFFTHGTHITVGHSMGTTIGINTMILFASLSYVLQQHKQIVNWRRMSIYLYGMNGALLLFWGALIAMGIKRSVWTQKNPGVSIQGLHADSYPYYLLFIIAGSILCLFILLATLTYLKAFFREIRYMIYPVSIQEELDRSN